MVFLNTYCLDITSESTPDPWVVSANGTFYFTFTANSRLPMWETKAVINLYDKAFKGPVWLAPPTGPQSERLWAPELHALQGRWYIYFAGADARIGNRSHRMYVMGGPSAEADPHSGAWELLGPIRGMNQAQWAIDGTVFELDGSLYLCYSGWPKRGNRWVDDDERIQQLFLIQLSDPTTARSEPAVISIPTEEWEMLSPDGPAINEGPQWLELPTGHWRGLVYSCSASWTKHYKMATLQYVGGDPLSAVSWQKSGKPLLQSRRDGIGPYGPGHGCFLQAGGETVVLFHATDNETDGATNRRCRMQRLCWTRTGPYMGEYRLRSHPRDRTHNIDE
ncbi:glycoside hydrolase family 43 protein [Piedraia hortae CBS 480.64]|uniref:Glycoside hydrolase family 43 protein n=1 Tax=Piedraia hortae CBS 480.64 TaxID=1314780 RepID=A0A6A7BPK1_9PEZI|nr:glycoside hydrolase family 43 protein [Piedraia hortae CBS 480.64]